MGNKLKGPDNEIGSIDTADQGMTPVTSEDQRWLADRIKGRSESRLLVRLDDDLDVAGHEALDDPTLVRVLVQDEDMDTVGHSITLRLPSAEEARAFRRRMLLTGVLVGTVVLGGAGAALAISQSIDPPAQAAGQIENVSYEDSTPNRANV